jgi:hypothetical protein
MVMRFTEHHGLPVVENLSRVEQGMVLLKQLVSAATLLPGETSRAAVEFANFV